ncbi:imm11 family protein [Franconibacter helveticus]|uniref:imm11 family protein n=1 Tax=Franconibacter helveticus TaxID=357240 RepID=UPI000DA1F5E5|nr:DUF1629 domain-containing protein [Franconibacter helveticus]
MTLDNWKFFVIEFKPDGEGLSHYIDKVFIPELPTFNIHTALPELNEFNSHYILKRKVGSLSGDYYPLDSLASDAILSLCSELNVDYFSIPLSIELENKRALLKKYNLFYLKKYLSIIDKNKSNYEIDNVVGVSNGSEIDKENERVYFTRIDKFVVKNEVHDHFFFCTDIGKPVCSMDFKNLFLSKGLAGLDFIPIDDDYSYDEWED